MIGECLFFFIDVVCFIRTDVSDRFEGALHASFVDRVNGSVKNIVGRTITEHHSDAY